MQSNKIANIPLRCSREKHSFTILEVVLAMVVMLFMTILVAAVVPISLRTAHYNSDFTHAASLVQHKINQLQDAGYYAIDGPTLGQNGLKIVDGTPGSPANNLNGSQSCDFEFTDTDKLWQYFSGGMDSAGNRVTDSRSPRGFIYISPYEPSQFDNAALGMKYGLIRATVTVQWWTSKGRMQSFSGTTLIPRVMVN